ncbi:3-oxoacyl-[acyl-carrier protein] reductase [Tistlia consotensis]|uniref:3-oxoacyl-[acyl-carrier protein] reductase n=1 Tax=Tistlia consotensis USBA 355 TaxID=560819 RepID=A0A1Y6B4W9_9PROT|nr:SDR family NAD(P)-dependent oxidoreductase [Tistlia consotensis]SME90432.1 3-oxoacyl-[acyl-carrier protein] reductase [Tistlia consotensis USBA 355]SNR26735.1 3-oxoacyl-[acyl-carrier protein] reductase [Tistlia consotensis]
MTARYDLSGRLAVVTGAAGGFGTAIGRRLKTDGARLVAWDRTAPAGEAAGLWDGFAAVDVTDEASIARAAETLGRDHGQLDILVNNAGIVGDLHPTWEIPVEEFRRILDVNLTGAFLACRALLPLMLAVPAEARRGRIVNVASIQAKEGMAQAAAYSAAKAGLVALTKSLGKELARDGILVNAITPAASLTAMSRDAPRQRLDEILARIPMGRFLEPDEVAAMVAWLASGDCSFTTGGVFDLSGGRATY